MTTLDHAKRTFWRTLVYPVFPLFHELFLAGRKLFGTHRREPHLIGVLAPGKTLAEFVTYLESHGFHRCRIAWRHPGQSASLRKLDGFHWQYHLRIFQDGEIRVHHEKTPEAHPLDHLWGREVTYRLDYFESLLGQWIMPASVAVRADGTDELPT